MNMGVVGQECQALSSASGGSGHVVSPSVDFQPIQALSSGSWVETVLCAACCLASRPPTSHEALPVRRRSLSSASSTIPHVTAAMKAGLETACDLGQDSSTQFLAMLESAQRIWEATELDRNGTGSNPVSMIPLPPRSVVQAGPRSADGRSHRGPLTWRALELP